MPSNIDLAPELIELIDVSAPAESAACDCDCGPDCPPDCC